MNAIILNLLCRLISFAFLYRIAQLCEFVCRELDFPSSWDEEFAAPLARDLESSNLRLVHENFGWQNDLSFEFSQEHVNERGAEEGTIKIKLGLWHVYLFTSGTVYLNSSHAKFVGHTVRENCLFVAKGTLTLTESSLQVASINLGHS
jgi:hypothetical protein